MKVTSTVKKADEADLLLFGLPILIIIWTAVLGGLTTNLSAAIINSVLVLIAAYYFINQSNDDDFKGA